MGLTRSELAEHLARMVEGHARGVSLLERRDGDELVIVWANAAETERLALTALPVRLRDVVPGPAYDRWVVACQDALATARAVEVSFEPVRAIHATVVPVGPDRLAAETRKIERPAPAELAASGLDGLFFMTFDEPIAWAADADHETLLDYAYDHLRVSAINDAMCAQLGSGREEVLHTTPRERWGADVAQWRAHMRQLFDQGRVHHSLRAPRRDGTWLDVEGEYVCTYDHAGRITGHYGTQRDVTEKRRTAAALARSQERLELAVGGGDLGIWDYDLPRQTIVFDEHWFARFGYPIETVPWRDPLWWMRITHPADVDQMSRAFTTHLAGETALYSVEHRMRTASGAWLWLLSSGRVTTRDDQGRPLRVVGTCTDITERKQLQERLVASERLASIGTLAAGVGHEINNPLTYIVLNLQLVERELSALAATTPAGRLDKLRAMLDQVRYGTDRVRGIVRDLQALTRVPENQLRRLDLVAIVERCLELADHQVGHRARVVRELAPVPAVWGSEGRMVQVVLNLIVNAAQAIPEGAADRHWVRVATRETTDGRVLLEVADSGAGIPPAIVGRIFDPFFTTKPIGEGTGLGLAICRSIVLAMDGQIEVDSTPGVGTAFHVLLPPAPPEEVIATPTSPVALAPARPRLRILVIDDEPIVGRIVAQILEDHDVTSETSGRRALARLRAGERFDRILCDLMMPELTGMDFYAELDPALRPLVVFLSGGAFTDRARTFLDEVPNRRLGKPFDVEQLTALLVD